MVIAVINYGNCAFEMFLPSYRGVFMEDRREVNMFEREKPITNISLTFLGVANKFDIIVV